VYSFVIEPPYAGRSPCAVITVSVKAVAAMHNVRLMLLALFIVASLSNCANVSPYSIRKLISVPTGGATTANAAASIRR